MLRKNLKLTPNARQSQILPILILLTSVFLVSGCGTNVKEIETVSEPTEKTPLDIVPTDPVSIDPVNWKVVTIDNVEEILREAQGKNGQPVLFALTESGYKQLSVDFAEIRNHINTQRRIILQYKQYYEEDVESN